MTSCNSSAELPFLRQVCQGAFDRRVFACNSSAELPFLRPGALKSGPLTTTACNSSAELPFLRRRGVRPPLFRKKRTLVMAAQSFPFCDADVALGLGRNSSAKLSLLRPAVNVQTAQPVGEPKIAAQSFLSCDYSQSRPDTERPRPGMAARGLLTCDWIVTTEGWMTGTRRYSSAELSLLRPELHAINHGRRRPSNSSAELFLLRLERHREAGRHQPPQNSSAELSSLRRAVEEHGDLLFRPSDSSAEPSFLQLAEEVVEPPSPACARNSSAEISLLRRDVEPHLVAFGDAQDGSAEPFFLRLLGRGGGLGRIGPGNSSAESSFCDGCRSGPNRTATNALKMAAQSFAFCDVSATSRRAQVGSAVTADAG